MPDESRARGVLIGSSFALLAIIVFGLLWFFFGAGATSPVGFGWYLFSFAAGLSMIVLPCTLPLAFVIVPLSMGKGVAKGLAIAIFFGLGVSITLSLYGVFAAILGKVAIGTLGAPLEVVKNWLYFFAGAFAYLFALGELGLVKYRMPSFSGAFPGFIQRQQDVVKAFLLGLLLGNIGVGCPHPATPVILTRIAVAGDVFYGWLLFFVHAVGRILPLIFLAILGILGVNALAGLVAKKEKIERTTGWAMVFVASFILVLGLFSHDWWVLSGQHTLLEELTQEETFLNFLGAKFGTGNAHAHGLPPSGNTGLFGLPLSWGTWTLLALWIVPPFWYYTKRKLDIAAMLATPEKEVATQKLSTLFWKCAAISILLVLIFGYTLPNRFLASAGENHTMEDMHDEMMGMHDDMQGGMEHDAHGTTHYHEEADVTEGIAVNLGVLPETPSINEPATLQFFVNSKPEETPVPPADLEIQHEKRMHVIGVRRDLTNFFHVHPESKAGSPSVFAISHAFPNPGEYKIWSEIRYQSENHTYGYPLLSVAGDGATAVVGQKDLAQNVIIGNYQVGIEYGGLGVGENHIDFLIQGLTGGAVELNSYLGEPMHLAVISEDLTQFIHAHPEAHSETGGEHTHTSLVPRALAHGPVERAEATEEDEVHFAITFPKSGLYKAFAQFQPKDAGLTGDQYLLAEFWLNVSDKAPAPIGSETVAATSGFADNWWAKLFVSVLLIAVLGYAVRKYITVPA